MTTLRARIRKLCDAPGPGDDRCTEPAGHQPADIHANGPHTWAFRDDPGLVEWLQRQREGLGLAKELAR